MENNQPFNVNDIVIAVDAIQGSIVKNGLIYRVYSCEQDYTDKGGPFWYVGVEGNGIKTHDRVRPGIFALIQFGKMMSFEKINEKALIHAN